ncbi:MAG TPA: hypothetical protein VKY57_11420 [Chitinispirillaceae bacterium]|nr:hypothetical protein [Chitinispirillaceae bacterium]
MNIERIHNNIDYNHYENNYYNQKKENRHKVLKKPINAFVLKSAEISDKKNSIDSDIHWLTHFVKDLPDEQVNARLEGFRERYQVIDDCLVDKLIMEEL